MFARKTKKNALTSAPASKKRKTGSGSVALKTDDDIKELVSSTIDTTTTTTNQPSSTKKKSRQTILNSTSIKLGENAHLQPIFSIPEKQMRFVSLTQGEKNFAPTLLMFENGGSIPPGWGVSANQQGKMQLKFSINDEEWNTLKQFNNDAIEEAKKRKDEWWGKGKITDSQIEDNYYKIVPEDKNQKKDKDTGELKEGEYWDVQFKVTIPVDDKERLKGCVIVDHDDMPVSYHEISGRQYEKCLIEIKRVFFMGRYSWGFGPKTLKFLKLKAPSEGDYVGKPEALDNEEAIMSLMGVSNSSTIDVAMKRENDTLMEDEPPSKKQKM